VPCSFALNFDRSLFSPIRGWLAMNLALRLSFQLLTDSMARSMSWEYDVIGKVEAISGMSLEKRIGEGSNRMARICARGELLSTELSRTLESGGKVVVSDSDIFCHGSAKQH
jgi:hypothetical protein